VFAERVGAMRVGAATTWANGTYVESMGT